MPLFTGSYPKKTGDEKRDIENLNDWAVALVDELRFVLSRLDECNISEAYEKNLKNEE